jgi:hypothetical protein
MKMLLVMLHEIMALLWVVLFVMALLMMALVMIAQLGWGCS